jgi:NAD(P)-dependent dehydrogenase (short-subunit alcohol dehydrogenase family)
MEQTILVTGSTSGFGRLTVETLARQGYRVFAGMRAAAGKNAPAAEALRARAQREALASFNPAHHHRGPHPVKHVSIHS